MPQIAYTMVGLLSIVSQAFKRNWVKLMQAHIARDPFESIPHHLTVTSWAALETAHAADPSRVEDFMAACYGMETGSLPRDWNEEHQSCRELPMENRRDRILRERTMFKISSDFVEAATKGAVAVIDRCIQVCGGWGGVRGPIALQRFKAATRRNALHCLLCRCHYTMLCLCHFMTG